MRILLKLRSLGNFDYDLKYFHKAQGFIYNLIRESELSSLHGKRGYKFFCFSNIFPVPVKDYVIKKNEEKFLLISSPSTEFIKVLSENLIMKYSSKPIMIGEMKFEVEEIKLINLKVKRSFSLISSTPIIVRIPQNKYDMYNIPEKYRKRRYVYWRPEYSVYAFVDRLESNLIKKYEEFYGKTVEIKTRIFNDLEFVKGPVINHVVIDGKEQMFVGSIWKFRFSRLIGLRKKILEFGIDSGFGERNSYGFGFINKI